MNWQPIATAPKDNATPILGFSEGGYYDQIHWVDVNDPENSARAPSGWYDESGHPSSATHWIYLFPPSGHE